MVSGMARLNDLPDSQDYPEFTQPGNHVNPKIVVLTIWDK